MRETRTEHQVGNWRRNPFNNILYNLDHFTQIYIEEEIEKLSCDIGIIGIYSDGESSTLWLNYDGETKEQAEEWLDKFMRGK